MIETETLAGIDAAAWQALIDAPADANSSLRYLTFCTIGSDGAPKTRLLVLRAALSENRELVFHTDTRSAKWEEIASTWVNP